MLVCAVVADVLCVRKARPRVNYACVTALAALIAAKAVLVMPFADDGLCNGGFFPRQVAVQKQGAHAVIRKAACNAVLHLAEYFAGRHACIGNAGAHDEGNAVEFEFAFKIRAVCLYVFYAYGYIAPRHAGLV